MADQLTVALELMTPLFLGGAEPRGAPPEVRAPSVRGVLRYWLRATLGANLDLARLKTAEAGVFGDTSESSAVTIRLRSKAQPFDFFERRRVTQPDGAVKWRLVHSEADDTKYLFFSLDKSEDQDARWCFKQGESVALELISRRKDTEAWTHVCSALWLLTRLGGMGARARRGAGALQFTGDAAPMNWPGGLPDLAMRAKTGTELVAELATGLTTLRKAMGADASTSVGAPTQLDVLAPGACRIWVLEPTGQPWFKWSSALGSVSQALGKARSSPGQLDAIREAMAAHTSLPAIDRAALGLPIVFHDVRAHANVGTLEASKGSDRIERRASPLHIRVVRLATNPISYVIVLTWFNALFVPAGSRLVLKEGERERASGDLPDSGWLDTQFWPAFDSRSNATRTEVMFR